MYTQVQIDVTNPRFEPDTLSLPSAALGVRSVQVAGHTHPAGELRSLGNSKTDWIASIRTTQRTAICHSPSSTGDLLYLFVPDNNLEKEFGLFICVTFVKLRYEILQLSLEEKSNIILGFLSKPGVHF